MKVPDSENSAGPGDAVKRLRSCGAQAGDRELEGKRSRHSSLKLHAALIQPFGHCWYELMVSRSYGG